MKIIPSPIRHDERLSAEIAGDTLILNGQPLNLSQVGEEALSGEFLGSEWLLSASRVDGELVVHLLIPHGAQAPDKTLFPQPIRPLGDGSVSLPPYSNEE